MHLLNEFSYHTNHIRELNARVSHGYQQPVENCQRNDNCHCVDISHCALCEIFREICVECRWERIRHKFCNCDRGVEHDARMPDVFVECIWKIERLHRNVHRFWSPWAFGVLYGNLTEPNKK